MKIRLREKDRALREALGDPTHAEIVTRSEVSVMLADHVAKRDLRDYVPKSDFQALSVSKSEFSQLHGILYEEVPIMSRRLTFRL